MSRPTPRFRRLVACVALGCAALLATAAVASADPTSDYNTGLTVGAEAYQYGVPLLDTERIFKSSTSVTVCDHVTAHGPVNQFCSIRNLATAAQRTINAPNDDTLYSETWLDLSKQPQVLHAPPIRNRFWDFELLDPWTNDIFTITSAHLKMGPGDFNSTDGGNWAVVGPHFKGRLPRGVIRVKSRYDRVWVLTRTYIRGPQDLGNVHRIQDKYSVTPLSKFGTTYRPPRPTNIITTSAEATIPGTQPGEDPLAFYTALGTEMLKFPPPAADRPLLKRRRRDAVTQGPSNVQSAALALYLKGFAKHNGYLITDLGGWGTNYALRAMGDRIGVGGQRGSIATYPLALLDDTKAPLTGSKRYVVHIPNSSLPIPVKAFWSMTMYDTNSFFVPNALNRYLINNRSHLHTNSDGSIDIYVQHDEPSNPTQASNWLPAPASGLGFRLIRRLYDLDHATFGVLDGDGWQPPPIQPCDPTTGVGSLGTRCAS